jgi:hypothetical protein
MKCKFCQYEMSGDDKYGCPNCMSEGLNSTHGGPRKGSGRPKGAKSKNAKGRTAVTRSVSMQPESWAKLDRQRGDQSRGKYIESKL